jgi:hypothetical protein
MARFCPSRRGTTGVDFRGYEDTVLEGDGNDLLSALRMAGEHYECRRQPRAHPPGFRKTP